MSTRWQQTCTVSDLRLPWQMYENFEVDRNVSTSQKNYIMTLNLRSRAVNVYPVDYSKWERGRKPHVLWASPHKSVILKQENSGTFVTRQPHTGASGKSQQNTIRHDTTTFPKFSRKTEKRVQDQVITKKNIKALMLLIMSRKEAIKDLEEHCERLREKNLQIVNSIKDTERNSLARSKELLIQQEQMKKSMIALKQWDDNQIRSVKVELTDAKQTSQTHLSGLKKRLDVLKAEVVETQKQLHILKTYKDMEFPVKALQIADMERRLEKLRDVQQNDCEDVKLLFEKEMANLEKGQRLREQEVLSAVVEKRACHIHPIVKQMTLQNHRMTEEIDMHRKEIIQLEQKNKELMKSIHELQLSRPNIKRKIFPDVFLKSDKCTPDMDVHLSIPQEDLLPI